MLFALNQNGFITDVNEVDLSQSYYCPACHEQLVAKTKGTKHRPHFAHKPNSNCSHGYETALHLMAKNILEESESFCLPEISFHRGGNGGKDIVVPKQDVSFCRVVAEKRLDGITPDIIGYVNTGRQEVPIAIEIFVTHRIDDNKLQYITKKKLRTIEIDLSGYKENDLTREELAAIVLGDGSQKYWVYNPKKEKKLEEYYSMCIVKKRVPVPYTKDITQLDSYCPRNIIPEETSNYCYLCPHLIILKEKGPYLCELP